MLCGQLEQHLYYFDRNGEETREGKCGECMGLTKCHDIIMS